MAGNAPTVTFQELEGVVAGAAKFLNIVATEAMQIVRFFKTTGGAPTAANLPALTNLNTYHGADKYPVPDFALDPVAPALYVCTTSGTVATSQWQQISGASSGPVSFGIYNQQTAYNPGSIVRVANQQIIERVTMTPGTYFCNVATTVANDAPAIANMVPQFPEPVNGTIYWYLIALGPQLINLCQNGGEEAYINSGSVF